MERESLEGPERTPSEGERMFLDFMEKIQGPESNREWERKRM